MLWTDADFITAADLEIVDPDVANVADAQDLTLDGAAGVIRRAIENAGRKLETSLVSFATYISSNDLSANHLAAVFYTGSQPNQRRRVTLEQIVVSGRNAVVWSDVKNWAVNRVLMDFYLSAANRAENDRYTEKRDLFKTRDAMEMWPTLKRSGCSIVYRPMPMPAALYARNPGTWAVAAQSLGGAAGGDFDVAITYVDTSKYLNQVQNGNAESQPSTVQHLVVAATHGLYVDITNLNPPTGAVGADAIARGFTVPLNAAAWNIYVGNHGGTLYLQNSTPIPISQKTYTFAADPVLSGYAAGIGQYADAYLTMPDLFTRA